MAKGFMTRRSGNPSTPAYEENMIQFFAMPGSSGKIRLKVQKPSDSDGVMIRQKSSAWVSGNTKDTGTLVATITDDTNYSGGNQWYEVSGLSDGTEYHFKAFPYKGSSYNETIGANETVCKAGGLWTEYTIDSLSGSTINDTSGNSRNGTMSANCSALAGKVGNGIRSVGVGATIAGNRPTTRTFAFWAKMPSTNTKRKDIIYCSSSSDYLLAHINTSGSTPYKLSIYYATGSVIPYQNTFTANEEVFIEIFQSPTTIKIKINNVEVYSAANTMGTSGETWGFICGDDGSNRGFDGIIDQFRIFSRELESYESESLYNGGAIC